MPRFVTSFVAATTVLLLFSTVAECRVGRSLDPLPELPESPDLSKINSIMGKVEIVGKGKLVGPEGLVVGQEYLFASLGDGRIARLEEDSDEDLRWTYLTRTGSGTNCRFSPGDVDKTEERCGRPLGMLIAKRSTVDPDFSEDEDEEDVLVVADAYKGLLMVTGIYDDADDVSVVTLATRAVSDPTDHRFTLPNGVVQAPDGSIYMTETTQTYQRRRIFHAFLDGKQDGRLLQYTKENGVKVVQENLYMPNGLTLSHNGENIIMVAGLEVMQYSIAQKKMISDLISPLPGTGDNIDARDHLPSGEKRNCYWIGLGSRYSKPFSLLEFVSDKPVLKSFVKAIVPYEKLVEFIPKTSTLAVYDDTGDLIEIYRDESNVAPWLSEGKSWGDYVYLGSWYNRFLARVKV